MFASLSVAVFTSALFTVASPGGERNYTIRGEGWFDGGNPRFGRLTMRESRLTLRDNGEFAVTLFVRNERYLVKGRWDRRGRDGLERIDISDAFGQRASGTGSLRYRFNGSEPQYLQLEGRTRDGEFHAEIADERSEEWTDRGRDDRADGRRRANRGWENEDDAWWGNAGTREFTERGQGWLRQDIGPTLSFDRMRLSLRSDRDAVIQLEGRRQSLRLRGRWSRAGDVVRVDLSQVNEVRARGRLEIRVNGRDVRSLDGAGQTGDGRFEVRFNR